MPKASPSMSPSLARQDDPRLTDIALRKKKNADAQAAFRARRANYISTLEETVTNLESVVLALQDSCRDSRNESQALRQEIARLRHEMREREKYWRSQWARKPGPDGDGQPPPPPPSFPHSGGMASADPHQYGGSQGSGYGRPPDDPGLSSGHYNPGASVGYSTQSTSLQYPLEGSELSSLDDVAGPSRDAAWMQPMAPQLGEAGSEHPVSPRSSGFTDSPTVPQQEIGFGHFAAEEQKVPLPALDTATSSYDLNGSRPITPRSSPSSVALASPFSFPENQDRSPRVPTQHSTGADLQVTPHPLVASPTVGASHYRLDPMHPPESSLQTLMPGATEINPEELQQDGDYSQPRLPPLRTGLPSPPSRSSSPGADGAQLTGTLAVIKSQAFGALRRTRPRTRKVVLSGMKIASDIAPRDVHAGGMAGRKRQRTDDDLDALYS